jgi:hypothetical protein
MSGVTGEVKTGLRASFHWSRSWTDSCCCTWYQWRFIFIWLLQANIYWRTIQHSSDRDEVLILAAHSKRREQNSANKYYCWWDTSFHSPILMGHDDCDTIKDYWSTNELYYTPFYSSVMKLDRFLHIMNYRHFENNENLTDRTSSDYNRWNIRRVFDYLNIKFSIL